MFNNPPGQMAQDQNLINIEAEQALLGALMAANQLMPRVHRILRAHHFADATHGRIYEAIVKTINEGRAANAVTLKGYFANEAGLEAVGGAAYLAALECNVISLQSAPDYAQCILDLHQRREMLALMDDSRAAILENDWNKPAVQIAAELASDIGQLSSTAAKETTAADLVEQIIQASKRAGTATSTGLNRLDNALVGGFHSGRFYAIAARMKAGKTTMLATIAYNIAIARREGKKRILYLCLEMTDAEIMQRIMARHVGCNALDFILPDRKDRPEMQPRYLKASAELQEKDFPLRFENNPGMDISALLAKLADAGASGRYDGVFIDYLQLVTGQRKGENEASFHVRVAQSVAEAVKRWPHMWVATAVQLNREDEVRGSDGVRMACDMLLKMCTTEIGGGDDGASQIEAWFEMEASRYTPFRDIGSEGRPAYRLNKKIGPFYEEIDV